jgi:hypothetical protein
MYRGENGNKCGIGQCIPDAKYVPAMESHILGMLLHFWPDVLGFVPTPEQNDVLRLAQVIHDTDDICHWAHAFGKLIEKHQDIFDDYTPPQN